MAMFYSDTFAYHQLDIIAFVISISITKHNFYICYYKILKFGFCYTAVFIEGCFSVLTFVSLILQSNAKNKA